MAAICGMVTVLGWDWPHTQNNKKPIPIFHLGEIDPVDRSIYLN